MVGGPGDDKARKASAAATKRGVAILDQRCVKKHVAAACKWVGNIVTDPKQKEGYRQRICQIETQQPCGAVQVPVKPGHPIRPKSPEGGE